MTPLAYLCALEYAKTHKAGSTRLNVLATSDRTLLQIKLLVDRSEWSAVSYLSSEDPPFLPRAVRGLLRVILLRLRLGLALRKIVKGDSVVVSHLDNPFTKLIVDHARSCGITVTVVDDGTATIEEFAKLRDFGKIDKSNEAVRSRRLLTRIEDFLFSTSPILAGDVQFFSFWSLQAGAGAKPRLLPRNPLSLIQSRIREQRAGKNAYFIGQPFVRRGVMDQSRYNALIRSIAAYYRARGLEFSYFPHRNETLDPTDFDFEIVENDIPFEIYLTRQPTLPAALGGFFSTTLATTSQFFQERMSYELFWGNDEIWPENAAVSYVVEMFEDIAASSDSFTINRTEM